MAAESFGPDLEEPKKLCFFYSRLQHRTTKAGASNSATPPPSPACQRIATTAWRRPRELESCATAPFDGGAPHTAPPTGTTFLCLSDAMENQPSSGRWKNGAKNTIFKERERRHFFAPWLAQYPILMAGDLTKTCLESHKEN